MSIFLNHTGRNLIQVFGRGLSTTTPQAKHWRVVDCWLIAYENDNGKLFFYPPPSPEINIGEVRPVTSWTSILNLGGEGGAGTWIKFRRELTVFIPRISEICKKKCLRPGRAHDDEATHTQKIDKNPSSVSSHNTS